MTVEEAQRRMSPREFLRWKLFVLIEEEDRWKASSPEFLYFAQTAFHVYLLRHVVANLFAKHPRQPEMEFKEFLFDFTKKVKPTESLAPKQVEEVEDEEWWDDTLELEESEEERQARFELANLNAHLRWSGFLGVPLEKVGADKFVKTPDEIVAPRSEEDEP